MSNWWTMKKEKVMKEEPKFHLGQLVSIQSEGKWKGTTGFIFSWIDTKHSAYEISVGLEERIKVAERWLKLVT